jgi:hypothetical protein
MRSSAMKMPPEGIFFFMVYCRAGGVNRSGLLSQTRSTRHHKMTVREGGPPLTVTAAGIIICEQTLPYPVMTKEEIS